MGSAGSQATYDLLVIGAGMSGLAAASRARARGLCVLVLEARDRIGGRIHTTPLNLSTSLAAASPVIDLGAAWIHGAGSKARGPNPLVALSKLAGIPTFNVTAKGMSFDPQGKEDNDAWDGMLESMSTRFESYVEQYLDSDSGSAADSLAKLVAAFTAAQKPALTAAQQLALRQWLSTEVVLDYAADLTELSAQRYSDDLSWGGPDALPARGYGALAAFLATGLQVRLRHAVGSIDYTAAAGVVVAGTVLPAGGAGGGGGADGGGGGSAFSLASKYVIVTLPLGYLQAQLAVPSPALFKPALTASRVGAITSLGVGLLNKVVLVWRDDSWWRGLLKQPWATLRNTTSVGSFSEYYNLAATPAKLPVIIAFNAASFARSLEPLSDAQTVAAALAPLSRLLPPGRSLPPPIQTFVTRWQGDPWSRGSYSYMRAGAQADARSKGFAPLGGGRVGFAGEHTHESYPATVHGALLSGQREADRVVAALAG